MAESMPTLRTLSADEVQTQIFEAVEQSTREKTEAIINDVKQNGESALLSYAYKFQELKDGDKKFVFSKEDLKEAFLSLPFEQRGVLERTAERIRAFATMQRNTITEASMAIAGGMAGQTVEPVNCAGCYAPGGRYPLPSSVLMTACTARVAGVPNVIVASPRPTEVTKAAAHVAGADCLLALGGAHAIAALAYGVGVKGCDIIVGPGNKWVTAAKSIVNGVCGIDMLAGPSEVLVIADKTADPEVVAADLLAQAEHDVEARPILVTPDKTVVESVNAALQKQLSVLTTREVAIPAVKTGFAIVTSDIDAAVAVSNKLGPEHLEIQTEDSQAVADKCKSFGGLFIGAHAAEVLGDYGAGPNHVLPTACTAKYTGGLSVHTFLRIRTWMRIDEPAAAQQQVQDSIVLARLEGLEGHARAAEKRLRSGDSNGGEKKQRAE